MDRAQVIADTLKELHEQDYRFGFNDSVLSHCCDALNEFDDSGRVFWSHLCCGRRQSALEDFMDSDKDLLDYYDEVEKISSGHGAFVMPHWGTRGT